MSICLEEMPLPPPINPLRIEVVGIHPQYARLLVIEIELDQPPTLAWIACFHVVVAETAAPAMHPPQVRGNTIVLHPTDADLEQEVAYAQEQILLANQCWQAQLSAMPALATAPELDSDMFSPDVRERIAAARQRTRSMSEAFAIHGF